MCAGVLGGDATLKLLLEPLNTLGAGENFDWQTAEASLFCIRCYSTVTVYALPYAYAFDLPASIFQSRLSCHAGCLSPCAEHHTCSSLGTFTMQVVHLFYAALKPRHLTLTCWISSCTIIQTPCNVCIQVGQQSTAQAGRPTAAAAVWQPRAAASGGPAAVHICPADGGLRRLAG